MKPHLKKEKKERERKKILLPRVYPPFSASHSGCYIGLVLLMLIRCSNVQPRVRPLFCNITFFIHSWDPGGGDQAYLELH